MNDLRIIAIVDSLVIERVSRPTATSVYMEGPSVGQAFEAFINDVKSSIIAVVNTRTIEVEIPEELRGAVIRNVSAQSREFTGRATATLDFSVSMSSSPISGLPKAVQQFLSLALQTPGTDIMHPERGGGLMRLVGSGINPQDRSSYVAPVMNGVDRTRSQLIASQAASKLPLSERLKDVTVLGVVFHTDSGSLQVQLGFETMAGHRAAARFGLPTASS